VAKNVWINRAKRNKKILFTEMTEMSETESDSQDVLNYLISNERKDEVKKVLEMLGEKCRRLLKMSIYQEMSGKEICEKMGFASENVVKTQKYKCKQKLLQIIKQHKPTLY
jgi:RNA polymerase sigma factor (sigma-70 family)